MKPEAAYFTEMQGKRTAVLIVHLDDVSKLPALAEPFFVTFGADCEWHPTMLPEDLGKANLAAIGQDLK